MARSNPHSTSAAREEACVTVRRAGGTEAQKRGRRGQEGQVARAAPKAFSASIRTGLLARSSVDQSHKHLFITLGYFVLNLRTETCPSLSLCGQVVWDPMVLTHGSAVSCQAHWTWEFWCSNPLSGDFDPLPYSWNSWVFL